MLTVQVLESKLIRSDGALQTCHRIKAGDWNTSAIQACPYPEPRYKSQSYCDGWVLSGSYYSDEQACKRSFERVTSLLENQP